MLSFPLEGLFRRSDITDVYLYASKFKKQNPQNFAYRTEIHEQITFTFCEKYNKDVRYL